MSTGTSCIVEQLGLAMMPSCHSPSSGFTWLTMSGTLGSIRQAFELSITVAPRAAASGASWRETSAARREEGDVDAFEGLGSRLPDRQSPSVGAHRRSGRTAGGEQPKLPDREVPFGEDLDHRSTDDASGTDDRDGQRLRLLGTWLHSGVLQDKGTRRVYQRPGRTPRRGCIAEPAPMQQLRMHCMRARRAGRSTGPPLGYRLYSASVLARWRCMAALRERLIRPWRSISTTTTMTSSPTETTSSTVGTW